MQIDPRMVKWDEEPAAPKIDPRMVKWDDDKPSKKDRAESFLKTAVAPATDYSGKDATGGLVRGSGSIGATLLAPFDMVGDALAGKGLSLESNRQRRSDMDAGLNTLGVNTGSTAFKTNKLGAEIAGTAGVGGVISNTLGRVLPASVQALPVAQKFIQAVQSGGMTLGGAPAKTAASKVADLVVRSAGGAVTGGVSAGLVDPENAKTGAVAGALLPIGAVGLGKAGELIGQRAKQKAEAALLDFNRNAPKNQTLKESIEAGYVVPPNMVKPSFKNQTIESISGKQATQQLFSEKNEKVTGSLVRKSLGIPDDAPITQSTLENLRKTAGKTYADVSALSKQAADDLEALKVARNEAQGWFQAYNRSARPDDLAKAKEARALSDSLEAALEQHAATAGKTALIPALREARKQIAKTYTVGRALNDAAGTVDARVLGRMHEKGLPLSDGLDVAGKFASAFPTVAKSQQQVGSAGAHNMKAIASSVLGVGGGMSAGIPGMGLAAIPFIAPPVARAAMLRNGVQKGLVSQAPKAADSALAKILMDQELQRLIGIAAPVAISRSGP